MSSDIEIARKAKKQNIVDIAKWMSKSFQMERRWPSLVDEDVKVINFQESWKNINSCLAGNNRGLSGKLSIKKLIPLAIKYFYKEHKIISETHPLFEKQNHIFRGLSIDLSTSSIQNSSQSLNVSTDQLIILTVLILNMDTYISWGVC